MNRKRASNPEYGIGRSKRGRKFQQIIISTLSAVCVFLLFKVQQSQRIPWYQSGEDGKQEEYSRISGGYKNVKLRGSAETDVQREKVAVVLERGNVWNLKKLRHFQQVIQERLLVTKFRFPKHIVEIEKFMKEFGKTPEYWKTALPTIFNPIGYVTNFTVCSFIFIL